jgi:hypothetical protein
LLKTRSVLELTFARLGRLLPEFLVLEANNQCAQVPKELVEGVRFDGGTRIESRANSIEQCMTEFMRDNMDRSASVFDLALSILVVIELQRLALTIIVSVLIITCVGDKNQSASLKGPWNHSAERIAMLKHLQSPP